MNDGGFDDGGSHDADEPDRAPADAAPAPDAAPGGPAEPQLPAAQYWPPGHPPAPDACVSVQCAACGQLWRVHERMRGFRLRCHCGAWVELPPPEQPALPAPARALELPAVVTQPRGADGLIELPTEEGEVVYQLIPTDRPMAPGTLRRASSSNQTRWTNRTVLEFVLLMAALLGPQLLAWLLARGSEFELLLPFSSLVSGALVAVVVAWAGPYGRLGFRAAAPVHFAEAVLVAGLGVGIATAYSMGLERLLPDLEHDGMDQLIERLGLPGSLFVIAVTPAVLEEVIFRGLLQGRLMALYGRGLGLFVTAVGFALCHGAPLVLPIHIGIGLYLGWLRDRAHSLLPGMLMHFLYNGTLVWLTTV
ncbi:MAG: CPBP family intramembrane metalloprotease [Planctomycetes bacterium]|nr:CPBP family intramembrane metalloprotease [Planctomycetota bacterium]